MAQAEAQAETSADRRLTTDSGSVAKAAGAAAPVRARVHVGGTIRGAVGALFHS